MIVNLFQAYLLFLMQLACDKEFYLQLFILQGGLKSLESIQEFYKIRNYEIIDSSQQHYYMKVHLQIDLQEIC